MHADFTRISFRLVLQSSNFNEWIVQKGIISGKQLVLRNETTSSSSFNKIFHTRPTFQEKLAPSFRFYNVTCTAHTYNLYSSLSNYLNSLMVAQASNSRPAIRSSFVLAAPALLLPATLWLGTFCCSEALFPLPLLAVAWTGEVVLKLRKARSTSRASLSMETSPDAVLASLPSAKRNWGPWFSDEICDTTEDREGEGKNAGMLC